MLMLGREIEMPIDLIAGIPPNWTKEYDGFTEGRPHHVDYAGHLGEKLYTSFEVVRQNLEENTRQKKHYDKASKDH